MRLNPNLLKMRTLKLTLLCLFVTAMSFANVSSSEKEALIALYNSTDLEVLKLYSNSLSGEIPADINGLTNLKELLLGSNLLTGTIPSDIKSLAKLEKLSLIDNKITGEIPVELAELRNLEELVLANNDLTGDLPFELSYFPKLMTFMVSDNKLDQDYISIVNGNNPNFMDFNNAETTITDND